MVKTQSFFPEFDITKALAGFKLPQFDIEALVAAQQRNFEAVAEAGKLAVAGAQALASIQAEIVRETFEQMSEAARDVASAEKIEDKAAKQASFAKDALKKSVQNVRSVNDIVAKTSNEALSVLSKRFSESVDEIASLVAASANGVNGAQGTKSKK